MTGIQCVTAERTQRAVCEGTRVKTAGRTCTAPLPPPPMAACSLLNLLHAVPQLLHVVPACRGWSVQVPPCPNLPARTL